jgi:hypothetical protein
MRNLIWATLILTPAPTASRAYSPRSISWEPQAVPSRMSPLIPVSYSFRRLASTSPPTYFRFFLVILSSRSLDSSVHLQPFRISTIPFHPSAVNTDNPYVSPFPLHLSSYLFSLFLVILSFMSTRLSVRLQPFRMSTIPFHPSAVNTDNPYVSPFPLHLSSYLFSLF